MSRRDDISKLYKTSGKLSILSTVFFWLNALAAIIVICFSDCNSEPFAYTQMFFAVACIIISIIDDGFFWYRAEACRRQNCIETAFDVDLSEEKTLGYYNNAAAPSVLRYALNNYESAYCSKTVSQKMIPGAIVKTAIAIMIFIIYWRTVSDTEIVLALIQIIFSSMFVLDTVMLAIYVYRVRRICDVFYALLISTKGVLTSDRETLLLANSLEYEVVKAFYKIRLNEKIFERIRDALDQSWRELLAKVKV